MKRRAKIFSGKESKELWKTINRLSDDQPTVHEALYIMGCRCQELEAVVDDLQRRLEKIGRCK